MSIYAVASFACPFPHPRLLAVAATAPRRPGSTLWLVPSQRAARSVNAALAQAGRTHVGITIHTFDSLAAACLASSPLRPLTVAQQHVLIDEIIAEMGDRFGIYAPVAETRGFAADLRALFDDLSERGIDPESWPENAPDEPLRLAYERYRERLATGARVDPAGRLTAALAHGQFPTPSLVLVDGFARLRPPHVALLHELARQGSAVWLAWPGDADDLPPGLNASWQDEPPAVAPEPSRCLIEAQGLLGEWRMVARRLRQLLDDGVPAETIAIVARHASSVAEIAAEVLADYAIAADVEGHEPLLRRPMVAALLRAARLADDGWPLADLGTLLRHTSLRLAGSDDPTLPGETEVLLRGLNVPAGRSALLGAVETWANTPPDLLEDEQAEASRHRRRQASAQRCRPFLLDLVRLWDRWPTMATYASHVSHLRRLAESLGLVDDDVRRWWDGLASVAVVQPGRGEPLGRGRFLHLAATVAAATGPGRTPRDGARVRVLSAEAAAWLRVDHLFLVGLGERGFPDLTPPSTLWSAESENERRATEERLYRQLLTVGRQSLTLSYAARDERGQELPPGPCLRATLESQGRPERVIHKPMLIEGYDSEEPLSAAERRVRAALALVHASDDATDLSALPADTAAHLLTVRQIHHERMQTSHYTAYDGLLRSPIIRTHLSAWFGPEQVLSPTSLERYVECPFRFFLQHILALEPLEEPGEQIEHTRRGSAVHRAMSRLHAQHHDPADDVIEAALLEELARAVAEYADRAPGPVARRLWQLEGQRLRRLAGPYVEQWRTFAQKWGQVIGTPRPWMLEADFGFDDPRSFAALEIERGGIQVRIAGRIDRIDRAETTDGVRFWVIDYKTGKASRYTADGLATMTQLQLALYTLAVERLFLAEERGRPGALAYWMPGDGGPKIVFPKLRSSGTPQALPTDLWEAYREQLEEKVAAVVGHIRAGDFPLQPSQRDCTATCPYNQVCRITQGRAAEKSFPLPLPLTRDSGERGT